MVSAGISGKGRLHFVAEKAKVNADYYVNNLLPKLIEDCNNLSPNTFIFQQDGAPAHTSRLAQEWIEENSPDFINKDEWPPNSPDLNPLDYHVWGLCCKSTAHTFPSRQIRRNWRSCWKQSGTTCHKSILRRLCLCSERECRRVSELMADILSTNFRSIDSHQQSALFRATTQFKRNCAYSACRLG